MRYSVARLGMSLLLCCVAIPVIAAQPEQTSPPSAVPPAPARDGSSNAIPEVVWNPFTGEPVPAEQEENAQNRLMFVTGDGAKESAQRLRERLSDPQRRVAMRAEQRAAVVSKYAGVGRSVGLDSATEQKLIEFLTDQQMKRLDQIHVPPRSPFANTQQHADETTQRMKALRDLLGNEKLERFQDFEMNQSGRYWVGQLSARLAPADQLQPDQEDRLTALKQEQFQMSAAASGSLRALLRPIGHPASSEDLQRDLQTQARIANENSWRKRQVDNRALEQKAAAFLTATQLAELSRYQAQEQDDLRRVIESARARAGMDPRIPEQPEVVEETPKLIAAQVQVEMSLTVNREPTTVTRKVRNGESFTFEAAQGLIVEVTPRMYDDDGIDVHFKYYEDGATGRRFLSGGSISTTQARQSDGSPITGGGGSKTVITGSKGYAVETTVNAKVL